MPYSSWLSDKEHFGIAKAPEILVAADWFLMENRVNKKNSEC